MTHAPAAKNGSRTTVKRLEPSHGVQLDRSGGHDVTGNRFTAVLKKLLGSTSPARRERRDRLCGKVGRRSSAVTVTRQGSALNLRPLEWCQLTTSVTIKLGNVFRPLLSPGATYEW